MSHKTVAEKFQAEEYELAITGRNVLVTEAMKEYVTEKLSKVERFSNRLIHINVTMDIQKLEHKIDISMKVDHIFVKSSAATDDMYASIDKAVGRLESQLLRYKEKIHEHQSRIVQSDDMNVNIFGKAQDPALMDVNEDIELKNQETMIEMYRPHEIVHQETYPLKTLNNDEAIMKMELSGDAFMLFRSESDNKLKVIYRRDDHHFGIIEPEK